jgi:hypothetical protein
MSYLKLFNITEAQRNLQYPPLIMHPFDLIFHIHLLLYLMLVVFVVP